MCLRSAAAPWAACARERRSAAGSRPRQRPVPRAAGAGRGPAPAAQSAFSQPHFRQQRGAAVFILAATLTAPKGTVLPCVGLGPLCRRLLGPSTAPFVASRFSVAAP